MVEQPEKENIVLDEWLYIYICENRNNKKIQIFFFQMGYTIQLR